MCLFQSHNKNTGNLRIDTCTMETDYYNGLLTGISIVAYNSSKEYLNKQGESLIDNIFFKITHWNQQTTTTTLTHIGSITPVKIINLSVWKHN